jgi:D-alanyl-D-alanine carboxypeptidase
MHVEPDDTRSAVGPVRDGTIVAANNPGASRSRRAVLVALVIAAIVSVLMLPMFVPSAAADAPSASPGAESSLDLTLVAKLEAALDKGFADSGVPGMTVALWIPGQGEWVATRGVSNIETHEPMDRANQGKIGSITKTLVGTVALQIIGEGQVGLTLDDTIDRWYPDFPEAANITVRMLMNMSSGIANPGQAQIDRICADPYSTITPEEYIAIGAATPREPFAPGAGSMYSGFNTFLLARILENTTGVGLTTLLNERLLTPLGMTRSRFAPDGQLTAPLSHGYTDFCPQHPHPTDATDWYNHESWAAGAMLSTIDDLHTWGLALGAGFGLNPQMLAARVDDTAPGDSHYGLNVGVRRDAATGCVLELSHAGAEPGYGADVAYYPTTGSVFALMGNGDGGTGEASFEVLKALAPVLLPVVDDLSSESCRAAPASVVTATPVTVEPAFTG